MSPVIPDTARDGPDQIDPQYVFVDIRHWYQGTRNPYGRRC
ncbi:MAG: hypothetical protein IH978_05605 [Nitrospinae bacterium]|nr:hypothetical protein [Nitrospinota bacterium]